MSFVPLGKQGVGRVKDHGGRLAAILDQIAAEKAAEKASLCPKCGRELHGYRGPLCRYCDPEAYSE